MARRNDHTRDQLKSLTLNSVKEFLETRSHNDLSLRKIANMIGYVPSTLVNVFGSYNLLLLHVVAQTLDELAELAQQSVSSATDNRDALKQLAYLYHDFACDNPHRWQLIFAHSMNGEQLPDWQANRIDGMTGMLEHLLVNIATDKSCDQVVEASRVLWAGVHGITMLSVDDKFFSRQPMDGKALIDNLLDSYLSSW